MDWTEFSRWGSHISQWAADYHATLRERPVRAQVQSGEISAQLPAHPPESGEPMDAVMADFERIVMPGITHWQHPRFFAYFPANAAPPSMLAEMLVSTIAPQCMLWQTSPAATEMETRMLEWLRQALGLPGNFSGVIQDSASSATLAAVLTMRERALGWTGNAKGLSGQPRLRVYTSAEVHTSVDRAIWVSGIGEENLVRIPTGGPLRAMDPAALDAAIRADIENGFLPCGLIACTGGTGTGACDDLAAVIKVAKAYNLYTHVDAAWAGSAMICPEFRTLWEGVDGADSVVFNPHKWLGAQFDCSAHFIADPESLVKTLAIQPEYLKTHGADGIINYSEWSVPLGRRFRALKLWFLIRSYGLEGLRQRIRNHVAWSQSLAERLRQTPGFEIVTEPVLSLFTFLLAEKTDAQLIKYVNRINTDGRIYITQTRVDGQIAIRFQVGQFDATRDDVDTAFDVLTEIAETI
ncbi:pyridoxal phosphate-dependent decarboxylase family protein [Hoeflea sp.]|uniref:pyridoxal phosphate-dependent decarboxylase family protein n=1 Tax=Hoeflea sp. TaxID=1940281 RepID=UPI003A8FFAF4